MLRKDTIDVPAGRFPAIVVQPIFQTSLFSEGGHAEVWLSDDDNRIMLQMKSSVRFGSLSLYLKSYRPPPSPTATPLAPAQQAADRHGDSAPARLTREADLAAIRTVPVARRPNKVKAEEFAHPRATIGRSRAFVASLPDVLVARDFVAVVDAIASAARRKRGVVAMLGGHIVKTGISPLLIDLMRRDVITHIAMNGSAAIHDYEVARFGATSEDVAAGLRDGTFGMADETGREMNDAFVEGMRAQQGMGEALGRALVARSDLAHPEMSLLRAATELGNLRDGPRRARRRDHSPASGRERRGDRRHEPPRFSAPGRIARRHSTTAASCSTWAAR